MTSDHPAPGPSTAAARRGRTLVGVGAGLFAVSVAFPVVAALLPLAGTPPWLGVVDVALAVVLFLVAALIAARAGTVVPDAVQRRSYRLYRILATLPLALLVVFFLVGGAIRWEVLLPGLAWRAWLLCYFLPAALTLWARDA
jgi:hypothetical protein